ncbi:MAG: 2-C-methyl-D-erythritol 2,4-cyclodiphosphate synthase [Bacteroidales bacterium]|nr:2-C-methyl-D-erythritol 2,4-cyclodiphosphate synthase [Bacteroidales bacterium]MCF8387298.1 2-C-methyl-D-erythritol 2,4-cyclodiphosphate synthase [Bacteroidales bacterium]MCF8396718.1 2-C-methyl-D-erythritol 2,4-cyclodiphosphate synthase [Bacteroidales bacterium]
MLRTGFGYDLHRLESGYDLWLGGIRIEHEKGAVAHSDGDTLIHAICDALLGAACLGDIGKHFPDTSSDYKNVDSKELLKEVMLLLQKERYSIQNIDTTVILEKPKLAPHIESMRKQLAAVLQLETSQISVKAKTNEKTGLIGEGDAVAAFAVCLINRK